jgi:hypothetical protein
MRKSTGSGHYKTGSPRRLNFLISSMDPIPFNARNTPMEQDHSQANYLLYILLGRHAERYTEFVCSIRSLSRFSPAPLKKDMQVVVFTDWDLYLPKDVTDLNVEIIHVPKEQTDRWI